MTGRSVCPDLFGEVRIHEVPGADFLLPLVLLAGLGVGFGYPYLVENLGGHDLGNWRLYEESQGYQPVDVDLKASDAPVRVLVEMSTVGQPVLNGDGAVLTLTADHESRTVLAETLAFEEARPRETNPQTQERVYRDSAGQSLMSRTASTGSRSGRRRRGCDGQVS